MNIDMLKVPQLHRDILDILEVGGHAAYICGGAVRDMILGLEPKDFDITTSATPRQIADLFQYNGFDVDQVGAHFGVSLVKKDGQAVEVATFRKDGRYTDSRRPDEVKLVTNPAEDVSRRDFTVNGLLVNRLGSVNDFCGGLFDLKTRTIRAIGNPDERFSEDPVRMIRAVRFVSKLPGFSLHQDTMRSIFRNRERLKDVAVERVRDELVGILQSGNAERGILTLGNLLLFDYVLLPEVVQLGLTQQNPKHHPEGSVYIHTLKLLRQLSKGVSVTLALAALLHDIGKPATLGYDAEGQPTFHGHEDVGAVMTNEILHRLKFPTEIIQRTQALVADHMRFRVLQDMKKAKRLRFLRQSNFSELLELHRMDALAGSGNLSNYKFALMSLADIPEEILRPPRLVTGYNLIALGLTPGPRFKEILEAVEDAQMEGRVTTKDGALRFAYDFVKSSEYELLMERKSDG